MTHAHLLVARLLDVGIHAEVGGENLQGLLGEIPMGWSTAPTILVPEEDGRRAAWLLHELEEGREPEPDALPPRGRPEREVDRQPRGPLRRLLGWLGEFWSVLTLVVAVLVVASVVLEWFWNVFTR